MERFRGWFVMALCCCMLCAATVHAKSLHKVYLKDGGIIECQKYWKEDGRVKVLVNRDVLVELAAEEVNMKRTFAKKPARAVKKAKAAAKGASAGKVEPAAGTQTPAPSGTAPIDAGKAGATPAPKPSAQPPGAANQAPGAKPAVPPSPQQAAAPAPGAANQPPGPKPAVPPSPQQAAAPASAAKPVSPGQEPAAKTPAAPVAAPERTTLPVVDLNKPAPRPPVAMPGMGTVILVLVLVLFLIASLWKVFTKAGEPGWHCLIPLWNLYLLVKISGKPWWWFLLTFVPVVGIVVLLLVHIALAARFSRGVLFGLGLFFFGFIFYPILAFGDAEYQ